MRVRFPIFFCFLIVLCNKRVSFHSQKTAACSRLGRAPAQSSRDGVGAASLPGPAVSPLLRARFSLPGGHCHSSGHPAAHSASLPRRPRPLPLRSGSPTLEPSPRLCPTPDRPLLLTSAMHISARGPALQPLCQEARSDPSAGVTSPPPRLPALASLMRRPCKAPGVSRGGRLSLEDKVRS